MASEARLDGAGLAWDRLERAGGDNDVRHRQSDDRRCYCDSCRSAATPGGARLTLADRLDRRHTEFGHRVLALGARAGLAVFTVLALCRRGRLRAPVATGNHRA